MVYLHDEWFIDKKNDAEVRELITELKRGIRLPDYRSDKEIYNDIKVLGEMKILKMLKDKQL